MRRWHIDEPNFDRIMPCHWRASSRLRVGCEHFVVVSYGGTERVVSWLTDELVGLGHDVTLFASGDSRTRAKLAVARAQQLERVGDRTSASRAALRGRDVGHSAAAVEKELKKLA
jgi:hypothetical protein